jgi:tetratricopeptide (TPR) repeat protein
MEWLGKDKNIFGRDVFLKLCFFLFMLCVLPARSAMAQNGSSVVIPNQSTAQVPSAWSLEVSPTFEHPLGDSTQWFSYGGAVDLGMRFRLPQSIFSLLGGIEYFYASTQASESLSLGVARLGGRVQLPLASGISVLGYALGGYYFATYNDLSRNASEPYVAGGLGLQFSLRPGLGLEVGAQYKDFLGLYQGVSAGVGMDVALGNSGGSVEIPTLQLRPAFPVFYKYYDDHPIGSVEIKSKMRVPATDVKVQMFIKEYMDSPKVVSVPGALAPGETKKINLYALFTDKVLDITEGTKVATEITVSYVVDGQTYENKKIETLSLMGRNAMTWDDNHKAAAFVTAKEPQVLTFARSVTSSIHAQENRSVCENLQAAIALHEALDLYGINYTPNPVMSYSEASKKKDVIDFLQFPRETFQYKAGDCSDLAILYGALLQAVGIDAAFITVPGHIYVAVSTGLSVEQASAALIRNTECVVYKGMVWIPVEITMRHQGFLKAWQMGAKEWNENNIAGAGQAGFYPIQEAWASYQPVGLPGAETNITVPPSDKILAAYQQEVQKYIDAALLPQVAVLQAQIQTSGSPAAINSLGVLYARYGQGKKAETSFKQALAKSLYLPALLNLGKLCSINKQWKDAFAYYQKANEMIPDNPQVILALTRVNLELQKYDDAKQTYNKLKSLDPEFASQYAYLGGGDE